MRLKITLGYKLNFQKCTRLISEVELKCRDVILSLEEKKASCFNTPIHLMFKYAVLLMMYYKSLNLV